jgi:hypothetical protein
VGGPFAHRQRVGQLVRLDAGREVRGRRDRDFRVADVAARLVASERGRERRDVLAARHQAVHRHVDLDEVREVVEVVEPPQRRLVGRHPALRVPARQPEHGLDGSGADQMDMELHLGQRGDEVFHDRE